MWSHSPALPRVTGRQAAGPASLCLIFLIPALDTTGDSQIIKHIQRTQIFELTPAPCRGHQGLESAAISAFLI